MKINNKKFTTLQKLYPNSIASLGGFSNDIGNFGLKLTYDPKCKIYPFNKYYAKSTCTGFKGASGGAIVLTIKQLNKTFLVGVVSHFKNNNYKNIYFTPIHSFYKYIKKACDKFNLLDY